MNSAEDFWKSVAEPNDRGCMNWIGYTMPFGHGRLRFNGKKMLAHRVAWILTNGAIPTHETHHGTMVVCHKCDNPSCCNPDHLFLGTQADNVHDRDAKNRGDWSNPPRVIGSKASSAKLTEAIVSAAKKEHDEIGTSFSALARRHGVHSSVMSRALRNVTWKHV